MKKLLVVLITILACLALFTACGETAHQHSFGEWTIIKDATCADEGEKERSCSCGEKETQEIEKLPHTEIVDEAVEATCTSIGISEGKHCSVCNAVTVAQKPVAAKGHTEVVDAAVSATCTTAGKTEGKHCSVCNVVTVLQTEIKASGHAEVQHKAKNPTCTEKGNEAYVTCSKCDYTTYKEIDTLPHNFVKINPEPKYLKVAATCTEEAVYFKSCTCGEKGTETFTHGELNPDNHINITKPVYTSKNGFNHEVINVYQCCQKSDGTTTMQAHNINNDACTLCNYKITYVDFRVTPSNREKVGYKGIEGETLVIPEKFQDTDGTWYNVTTIGASAFEDCEKLVSVTIPNSVTSVEEYAFFDCTKLQNITIPSSVTSLGNNAFKNTAYYNNEANWENSVLYIDKFLINAKTTLKGKYTIKSGTLVIAGRAFYECENLTSVIITSGVTSICASAFDSCYNLTSVTIPSSVTRIEYCAFDSCSKLANITLPNTLSHIGWDAFYKTAYYNKSSNWSNGVLYINNYLIEASTSLYGKYTVKSGTLVIAERAFQWCSNLTGIVIPSSVRNIGEEMLRGCDNLTSISVNYANTVYHSSGNCIIETASKTLVAGCKSSMIPTDGSVVHIGNAAFMDCYNLTSITIPNSIKSIGDSAFYQCGLTSIVIPDSVITIGMGAFYECPYLSSVTLGNNVISIGEYAFTECYSLTSISIPNSVTSIGDRAFECCESLTSVTLSNNITKIGYSTFYGCESLTNIIIPNSVTTIGRYAFAYTAITNITIPNSVTNIEKGAFGGCDNLTNVTIPNSVTSIGERAFDSCDGLMSVTIPNSVTSIGERAFDSCDELVMIYYLGTEEQWNKISFGSNNENLTQTTIVYNYNGKQEDYPIPFTITYYNYYMIGLPDAVIENLVIPEKFKGADGMWYKVIRIDSNAFREWIGLTSVTIPSSVTSIGTVAFYGCSNLTSVTIGNGVTSIGEWAFEDCIGLTSLTIPSSVTSIGEGAFAGCDGLTSIKVDKNNAVYYSESNCIIEIATKTLIAGCKTSVIPSDGSVTSIGDSAFSGCSGLTSITIPDSVTSIGDSAFSGCSSLEYNNYDNAYYLGNSANPYLILVKAKNTSITSCIINEKTRFICSSAFFDCYSLTSITIPDSVVSIGRSAFAYCSRLTSVTIPNSVTTIGDRALYECSRLTSVYYTGTADQWNKISIGSYNTNLKNATRYYYSETQPTETGNYWHYVDGVPTKW